MPLVILPCFDCRNNLINTITKEEPLGVCSCDKYPERIPTYVEDGSKDCPKFQAEKKP